MELNTLVAVNRVAGKANAIYLEAIRRGNVLFQEHGITTPLRMAHFLAQALHETGGFTVLRENMNYSEARLITIFGVNHHSAAVTAAEAKGLAHQPEAIGERVYGLGNPRKARDLGNDEPGDGFRFRGNGLLQTTGRGNHRRMGEACGLDFEGSPELVTDPDHALKPALQEWTHSKLNGAADRNDIRTITLRINGGLIGLSEREAWLARLWPLLKAEDQLAEPWESATADNKIRTLQKNLNTLGADPALDVDGRYGPGTRRAVKAFQAAAGIVADGVAGPVTVAAIKLRLNTLR
jgi:putative chitinase